MIMKAIMVITATILSAQFAFAQSTVPIEIEYDDAGNRVTRKVITMVMSPKIYGNNDSTYYVDQLRTTQVKIYPNPMSGKIVVELNGDDETKWKKLRIYNDRGGMLFQKDCQGRRMELDLSAYPTGQYLLELFADEEQARYKIVKID